MTLLQIIEYCLGRLLYRLRAYDSQLLHKSPAFAANKTPTIRLTSPDCGASGATFSDEYAKCGGGKFPTLTWEKGAADVKEWLLLAEDPDAPLRKPNVHGLYCCIPPHVTALAPEDLELIREVDGVREIKAGYRVGKNRRNMVYIPPRPPLGHGPHRYLFQLVGLSQKLDELKIGKVPTKKDVEDAIVGKVAAWGMWEASYETHW